MRFGLNTWALECPVDGGNLYRVFKQISELGIPGERPLVEVFASPDEGDLGFAHAIREMAAGHGFGVTTCGFNPYELGPGKPSPHLASPDADERKTAVKRALGFVDFTAEVAVGDDPGILGGPWYARHKYFTNGPLSPEERGYLVSGLREIASRAEDKGVRAGMEVLNRFETYVLNTVGEALSVADEVGSPNVGVHWDSSHAHSDEPRFIGSLDAAVKSGRLFHVHLCENHRRELGTGQIGVWIPEIVHHLEAGGYEGGAVLELFCPALYPAVGIWGHPEDPVAVARNSINYIRQLV